MNLQKLKVLAIAGVAAAATLTVASPANASIGPCYLNYKNSTSASGWCDGTGPNHEYQMEMWCNNSSGVSKGVKGPRKWMGDRTGSAATCPSTHPTRTGSVTMVWYEWNGASWIPKGTKSF